MRRLVIPVAILTLSVAAAFLAWAQPFPERPHPASQPGASQGLDDPSDAAEHAVGRLSLVNGAVSLSRGDSSEFSTARINEPLVTTDRLVTGARSRAEIQFDQSSVFRLAANTEVRMGDLRAHRYLVQVIQGTTLFRLLHDTDARIDISTPSVSVAPLRAGIYLVTVRPDGSSEITVRAGEADLNSPSGSERLPAGETMFSRGPIDNPQLRSAAALPYDDWDRWNADRDRYFERTTDVSRYVPSDIQGAEELANYGRWMWDAAYGYVWVPDHEAQDWAPYRDGRWEDVDYYGWSWVGNEPWGWAPYHYGNWYRAPFGWAWYPGTMGPRHYWRPALVGFFGFGEPGFGVSLGFGYGNVGWVPLAPFERYRPWYGRGYNGGRNINIVNNTNITNVYRNARFSGAVTGVRAADFGRAGVDRNAFVRPSSGDLIRSGVVSGGAPFAPGHNVAARSSDAVGATRFTTSQSNNVVRLDGQNNNGGWRRLESQPGMVPAPGGARSDVRMLSPRRAEPVRISPPIVNNRFDAMPDYQRRGGPNARDLGGFGAPPPAPGTPVHSGPPANPGSNRALQSGAGGYRGVPPANGGGPRAGGDLHGGAQSHGGGHGR